MCVSVCVSVCGGQRNIKKLFFRNYFFRGFLTWGLRIWVIFDQGRCRMGSCDQSPLPRSKKHRNLVLLGNPFFVVFGHREDEHACVSVWDHFQGGYLTLPHFRGQKNIENYFCLKIHFQRFSGMRNTDMSVNWSQPSSRGVVWPPFTSGVKRTPTPTFARKLVLRGLHTQWTWIWVWIGLGSPPEGSRDPTPLPGSKEHQKLLLPRNLFPIVFEDEEHEYECDWATDHAQGITRAPLYFCGQNNIEN